MTHRIKIAGLQPVQVLAGLAGIAFIVFGVVGFTRTGIGDWAAQSFVLGFSVNPLHNLVMVAVGVLGLLTALGSGLARMYGWLLFAGFAALFVWDLMITGILAQNPAERFGNPLAVNVNDNWLHLGIALFGLLLAVMPARRKLIEEEDPVLPEPRSEAFHGERDGTAITEPLPTAARTTEPITREQAVVDPKTERVSKDRIKH
ncbi:DUF4383 domain-containing protein [Lentzea flaviverrucosa]|uniref:DUF4383 domain-containing protein n=1 Tax=Lentzea flaviverrucosa TaxID=200379 RepID=A0A1H9XWP1_9PSEU|nr:DUF4383 domain-containing protein [Lentzea flaviverrucosa]RDI18230.1 uncharacterized protein DUF4383 [Lentzea flaviverrucosa]SES50167.1 protein of unknown function [Lentzea flaviverrucosa]